METFGKEKDFGSFEQVESNYCGPACIEMLLDYFGLRPSGVTSESLQKTILSFEGDGKVPATDSFKPGQWEDWVTNPIELVNMLHGIKGEVTAINEEKAERLSKLWVNYFIKQPNQGANAEAFMTDLENKLKDPSQPALIIPIHDSSHWVILHRVTNNDGKKTFIGKDPMVYSKKEKLDKSVTSYKGTITIARNKLNFSSPDNLLMVMFTGDEVKNINSRHTYTGGPSLPTPVPIQLPGTPVQPQEIIARLNEQLVTLGMKAPSSVGRVAFTAFTPPLLVNQRHKPNSDYYLVTEKNAAGEITQIIRMDARTGDFLDSLQLEPVPLILGKNVMEPVQGRLLTGASVPVNNAANARMASTWLNATIRELNKTDASGNNVPKMIWEPCKESESAFFPFYEVTVNNEPSYLRIDGARFSKITSTSVPVKAPDPNDSKS